MRWHSLRGLLGPAWRERSTWAGAVFVVVAAVWASFSFSADQLGEYAGRWAIIGPAVIGALGFLGILKRDKAG